ncbi:sphingosine kinase 1 [Lissotriton helveticus]
MDLEPWSAGASPEVLLCGSFTQVPGPPVEYALTLTTSALYVQRLKGTAGVTEELRHSDCLGSWALRPPPTDPLGYYFTVTTYPPVGRRGRRLELCRTFRAGGSPDPEENRQSAEKWARRITQLAVPDVPTHGGAEYSLLPRPCQLLIFVNPRGGKGTALSLFKEHVLPILSKADIGFNLIVTERPNHARELAREKNLDRFDALVVMSGDGLMYEVVNGLMERPDWSVAIKKPLGILPAGSGNALAASVNHYSGHKQVMNPDLLINCTFYLCKGLVSPLDLVSITTASGKRIFSFLSVAWGFVSDVDIESEKYRMLGPIRFTMGTLVRLAALRTYKGRVSYLPAEQDTASASMTKPGLLDQTSSHSERLSPADQVRQNTLYNFCNSNNMGKAKGCGGQQNGGDILNLEDSLMAPLDQPVPTHWTVVKEENFVLFLAIQQSHLGADLFSAPMVTGLSDNLIHLFYIPAGIPRSSLLKLFLAMENGTHMTHNCPHLIHVPVKAFRIEPFGSKDIITVDGEVIECEPLQGQVHSGLGRLINGGRKS